MTVKSPMHVGGLLKSVLLLLAAVLVAWLLWGCNTDDPWIQSYGDGEDDDDTDGDNDTDTYYFPCGTSSGDGNPNSIVVGFDTVDYFSYAPEIEWTRVVLTIDGIILPFTKTCSDEVSDFLPSTKGAVEIDMMSERDVRAMIYAPSEVDYCNMALRMSEGSGLVLDGVFNEQPVHIETKFDGTMRFWPTSLAGHFRWEPGKQLNWVAALHLGRLDSLVSILNEAAPTQDGKIYIDAVSNEKLLARVTEQVRDNLSLVEDQNGNGQVDEEEITNGNVVGTGSRNDDGQTPRLCAQPSSIHFDVKSIDQHSIQKVNLCNCGTSTRYLQLLGVGLEGAESNCGTQLTLTGELPTAADPWPLYPGGCRDISVVFDPCEARFSDAGLNVVTDYGLWQVPIEISAHAGGNMRVVCRDVFDDSDDCLFSFGTARQNDLVASTCEIEHVRTGDADNSVLAVRNIALTENNSGSFFLDEESIESQINGANNAFWLSPGEKITFGVMYRPKDVAHHQAVLRIDHNATRVDTICNDDFEPDFTEINISGYGVDADIVVRPFPELDFGNVATGTCTEREVEIANQGGAPLRIDQAILYGDDSAPFIFRMDAHGIPGELTNWESAKLDVSCCPTAEEGYVGVIEIKGPDQNRINPYNTIAVSCQGVKPHIQVIPSAVNFGKIPMGTERIQNACLYNPGPQGAMIDNIYISANSSNALGIEFADPIFFPVNLSSESWLCLNLRGIASSAGMLSATMVVQMEDAEEIQVPIIGEAEASVAILPDDCLTWQNEQVPPNPAPANWTFGEEILKLQNSGNAVMTISEAYVEEGSESFALGEVTLPLLVAPNHSMDLRMQFAPSSTGEHSGQLVICSDAYIEHTIADDVNCEDSDANAYSICLNGEAIDPQLDVQPGGPIIFRDIAPWAEETHYLTLRNTGVGPMQIYSITFDTGDPAITIPEGGIDPPIPQGEPLELLPGDDFVSIAVRYTAGENGIHYRPLKIRHNLKAATQQGGLAGTEYPEWSVDVIATNSGQTPPFSIAKVVENSPAGAVGTRHAFIDAGEALTFNSSSSYDMDPDDAIEAYQWKLTDDMGNLVSTDNARLIGSEDAEELVGVFNEPGLYVVTLKVQDRTGLWSLEGMADSKINVEVKDSTAPLALLSECETGLHEIEVEAGATICFDASGSLAGGSGITGYRFWIGDTAFSSDNPIASFVFSDNGIFDVRMQVVDSEGRVSLETEDSQMTVTVSEPGDLEIAVYWTGRGDVNVIPLNTGCESASVIRRGDAGGPEILSLQGCTCDSPPIITLEYAKPEEQCGSVEEERQYTNDCLRCGCDCSVCLAYECCGSCTITQSEWICSDVPADLILEYTIGNESTARFTQQGEELKLTSRSDRIEISPTCTEGSWAP